MLTALVVDDATSSRHRVATVLQLAGWRVLEVTDLSAAARAAARVPLDLVVTELNPRSGSALSFLRQLRGSGSRARFLLMTARPSARERAQAAEAGLVCLAKPIDPRQLIDFLSRGSRPAPSRRVRVTAERMYAPAPAPAPAEDDDDEGPSWQDRQRALYLSSLPHQLTMITDSARAGNASAVAAAAQTLAGDSGQHGHAEVATMCLRIADDARRGVLSQPRLMQLVTLASIARARRPQSGDSTA